MFGLHLPEYKTTNVNNTAVATPLANQANIPRKPTESLLKYTASKLIELQLNEMKKVS